MGKKKKENKFLSNISKKADLSEEVITEYVHALERWEDSYEALRQDMQETFAMRHRIDPHKLDIVDEYL